MAVGDFLIWLSGASRQVLAQCPTERPKFVGLGAAILVTAGMAAVSLSFALFTALKAPLWVAVIFALLWGLAIMSLDRLFVVSMHRYRNRFFYLLMATPRFLMAVLLGFVISTPFVLQIFRPEINHQIKLMQAAERSAYFKNLPHNPVYLTVQQDKATVTNLTNEAATGGTGINPSTDPTVQGWQARLTTAQGNEQTWFANLQCQLYGTARPADASASRATVRWPRTISSSTNTGKVGQDAPAGDSEPHQHAERPERGPAESRPRAGPVPARGGQAGAEQRAAATDLAD